MIFTYFHSFKHVQWQQPACLLRALFITFYHEKSWKCCLNLLLQIAILLLHSTSFWYNLLYFLSLLTTPHVSTKFLTFSFHFRCYFISIPFHFSLLHFGVRCCMKFFSFFLLSCVCFSRQLVSLGWFWVGFRRFWGFKPV